MISVLVIVVFVENEFSTTFTLYPVIASPPVSDGGDHCTDRLLQVLLMTVMFSGGLGSVMRYCIVGTHHFHNEIHLWSSSHLLS